MIQKYKTDVDIDVANREQLLAGLDCAYARINKADNCYDRHNTGVYFQDIPKDPFTNISTIDYREAGSLGYFKVDFLNVHFYEGIRNEQHLLELLDREPNWELFQYKEITDNLFHLNGKSELLKKLKPQSVEDLAMILAIIRPAKAYLQSESWDTIKREVWEKTDNDEYTFKRTHSISYSLAIIVHLNLLSE